jgi:hypothetical protein
MENSQLLQRFSQPLGVINTQTLHRHDQQLQNHTSQLSQRLALSPTRQTRYGTGVLQPTAMAEHFQIQRVEAMGNSELGSPMARIQRSPISEVETTIDANHVMQYGMQRSAPQLPQMSSPTLAEPRVTPNLGRAASASAQASVVQRAKAVPQPPEPISTSSPDIFRIRRRAMPVEMTASSPLNFQPLNSQPLSTAAAPNSAAPPLSRSEQEANSATSTANPPATPPATPSSTVPLATVIQAPASPSPLQRRPLAPEQAIAQNPSPPRPTLKGELPHQHMGTADNRQSPSMVLQRQQLERPFEAPVSGGNRPSLVTSPISLITNPSPISPLPLAISSTANSTVISRQPKLQIEESPTNVMESSMNSMNLDHYSSISAMPPLAEPKQDCNIQQISEQVYQRIVRQLRLERERRGMYR